MRCDARIDAARVRAYKIPTASPESDGTLAWDSTTLVYVEIEAAGECGIGFTYAHAAVAKIIESTFAPALHGQDAFQIAARTEQLHARVRNQGRHGITAMAVSAIDVALWDLKAKALDVPAYVLLGSARASVPLYGSGGFTSYTERELCDQLAGWVNQGIPRVKMKVGRDPGADPHRVRAARRAIGDEAQLFVDANGAYDAQQAVEMAQHFARERVRWFEEPVYRDDYEGMRFVREHAPPGMEVSSGEYGYEPHTFARILRSRSVDVLQADATRCGGFSGLLAADALCQAWYAPFSTHCAPHLHLHAALACRQLRHCEYFYDHVRIERMLFEGARDPVKGELTPDPSRPGIGLELRAQDAEKYAI